MVMRQTRAKKKYYVTNRSPRPSNTLHRFSMETKRSVDVLDKHLKDKTWVCGDEYSIADMAIYPWVPSSSP